MVYNCTLIMRTDSRTHIVGGEDENKIKIHKTFLMEMIKIAKSNE